MWNIKHLGHAKLKRWSKIKIIYRLWQFPLLKKKPRCLNLAPKVLLPSWRPPLKAPWQKCWGLLDFPSSVFSGNSELPLLSASTRPATQLDEFLLLFLEFWDKRECLFLRELAKVLEIRRWSALMDNEGSKEMWFSSSGLGVLVPSNSLCLLIFSLKGFLCLSSPWSIAPRPAASGILLVVVV